MFNKKHRKFEKCCDNCFTYIPHNARKCRFCGYRYKSVGKFIFDKLKKAFRVEEVYAVKKSTKNSRRQTLFTSREIDNLLAAKNFRILMYLVLDDIAFLDETALIELGQTLSMIDEH